MQNTQKSKQQTTLYWHDYETFGANPMVDRPVQFAGIRTDTDLNIIGDPLVVYCKPANDFIPHPMACVVTGITPQLALEKGLPEAQFIRKIHDELSVPGTCGVGYNSIRFDDEVTRFTLYRNFFDAYGREWMNGNSRWDIIDVARLTRALRPEGINWPNYENGTPCFKLEELTKANGISHGSAHDALSDVYATIELAKLIKNKQPKLYDYVFQHRGKRQVQPLLDVFKQNPAVHTSSRFPSEFCGTTLVVPIAMHPTNNNGIVCYDLRIDPEPLLTLSAEEIKQRVFSKREDLPEGVERIPLKVVHINRCPVVVPPQTLKPEDAERIALDIDACNRHLEQVKNDQNLREKVQAVFKDSNLPPITDPDQMLYAGNFFRDDDKSTMAYIRTCTSEQLAEFNFTFNDSRLAEMLFRYRARNFQETLNEQEQVQWFEYRKQRILNEDGGAAIVYEGFKEALKELQEDESIGTDKQQVLIELEQYVEQLVKELAVEVETT